MIVSTILVIHSYMQKHHNKRVTQHLIEIHVLIQKQLTASQMFSIHILYFVKVIDRFILVCKLSISMLTHTSERWYLLEP